MSKPLMFGLAGEMLSGKSSVAKFLVDHFAVKELRLSMILNKILDVLVLPQTRENQQNLARILREQFGDQVLAHSAAIYAEEQKDKIFLIDGIRKLNELTELQSRSDFKLIYIRAPLELRYQRLQQRMEKVGEQATTMAEFEGSHKMESEVDIAKLEKYADYVVDNTGDTEKLHAELTRIFTASL